MSITSLFDTVPTTLGSHMPFVACTYLDDEAPKALCCLRGPCKNWKAHYNGDDGRWRELFPSFSPSWMECNPTMHYTPEGNIVCSVIARDLASSNPFMLYVARGLDSEPVAAVQATSGFVFKNTVVYCPGDNTIRCENLDRSSVYSIPGAKNIYRIVYVPEMPTRWLVCGDDVNGELFSWMIEPRRRLLYAITLQNGDPAYKCVLYDGVCVYARRIEGGRFDDRYITHTEDFSLEQLPFLKHIAILKDTVHKDGNAEDEI